MWGGSHARYKVLDHTGILQHRMSSIIDWFMNLSLAFKFGVLFLAYVIVGNLIERTYYLRWTLQARKKRLAHPKFYSSWGCILPGGISVALGAALFFMKRHVHQFIQFFINQQGQTFAFWLGGMPMLMTNDPENLKGVLATQFKDFTLGTRYEMFFQLLGNGIFTLSGEGWKHSRTMLRPQFARDQISHLESIKQHVDALIMCIDEANAKGKYVDLQDLFHKLTLDTATEFLFGESTDTLGLHPNKERKGLKVTPMEFQQSFGEAQEMLAYRFISGPHFWRIINSNRFKKNCLNCKEFVDYFVNKALESPMEKDQTADKYVFINELTKETRDPVVIRDQALNILLAGRDTTASTMSFMAAYLSKYKDVYKKLREAVLEDFGPDGSTISFESLKRCKYLSMVMNEVLRLHPIVAVNFRKAIRDTQLPHGGGKDGKQPIFVPKGVTVLYSAWCMHHDKTYWGDDAEEFKPDRWKDVKGHSWEFLPFNGGPRICLGQQFALTEMSCVWVRLCQTYSDIDTLLKNRNVKKMGRQSQHQRLTISVDGGVPAKLTRAN